MYANGNNWDWIFNVKPIRLDATSEEAISELQNGETDKLKKRVADLEEVVVRLDETIDAVRIIANDRNLFDFKSRMMIVNLASDDYFTSQKYISLMESARAHMNTSRSAADPVAKDPEKAKDAKDKPASDAERLADLEKRMAAVERNCCLLSMKQVLDLITPKSGPDNGKK